MRRIDNNLAVGYRFKPTEEELLVDYLLEKVANRPLPCAVIAESDIYNTNDEEEWWESVNEASKEKEFYCFTRLKMKSLNASKNKGRVSKNGTWKETQKNKDIVVRSRSGEGMLLGFKKSFKFVPRNEEFKIEGKVLMDEYRLADWVLQKMIKQQINRENYVICHIKYEMKLTDHPSNATATSSISRSLSMITSRMNYDDNALMVQEDDKQSVQIDYGMEHSQNYHIDNDCSMAPSSVSFPSADSSIVPPATSPGFFPSTESSSIFPPSTSSAFFPHVESSSMVLVLEDGQRYAGNNQHYQSNDHFCTALTIWENFVLNEADSYFNFEGLMNSNMLG